MNKKYKDVFGFGHLITIMGLLFFTYFIIEGATHGMPIGIVCVLVGLVLFVFLLMYLSFLSKIKIVNNVVFVPGSQPVNQNTPPEMAKNTYSFGYQQRGSRASRGAFSVATKRVYSYIFTIDNVSNITFEDNIVTIKFKKPLIYFTHNKFMSEIFENIDEATHEVYSEIVFSTGEAEKFVHDVNEEIARLSSAAQI